MHCLLRLIPQWWIVRLVIVQGSEWALYPHDVCTYMSVALRNSMWEYWIVHVMLSHVYETVKGWKKGEGVFGECLEDRWNQQVWRSQVLNTADGWWLKKQKTSHQHQLCSLWQWHTIASFPGSSAPEREIELVHVERAWYFSHVRTLKGRKVVERP